MRKFFFILAFALFCSSANAAILTVDNNVGAGAMYTGVNAAVNASSAGDTILVHPSQYSYGDVTLNKTLTLVGPGHSPEISQGLTAQLNIVNVYNGSDGAIIEGFMISYLSGGLGHVVHNITIRNNRFSGSSAIQSTWGGNSDANDWIIEGNVFVDQGGCGGCYSININASALGSDNWIIRNNFFQPGNIGVFNNGNSTTVCANNLIVYSASVDMFAGSSNMLFTGNIFYSTSTELDFTVDCTNCVFDNNLFYNPNNTLVDVPGTDNIMNMDPMFEDLLGAGAGWNYNKDYHLSAGSPAIGAGADGNDLGIYGPEDYNFRMRGYPNDHPRMTFAAPQFIVVQQGAEFSIEFGANRAGE